MILLLDNYDSFTHNLAHYFEMLGASVRVVRNDEMTVAELLALAPERVCISPGPGRPSDAGATMELIAACAGTLPLLGVCLGHQAIVEHFGGTIIHAPSLVHGKTSEIEHDGRGLFAGLPSPMTVTRYHSLCASRDNWPDCLEITASVPDASAPVIMGLRHRALDIAGVQFHPEAILTDHGHALLKNWLDGAG